MSPLWFLRMSRWARRPPSTARVKLVIGVVLVCLAIGALGHYGYWPDWAELPVRRHGLRLH